MPHCKACDNWYEDRKNVATGRWAELCRPCDVASFKEAAAAAQQAEHRAEYLRTRDPLNVAQERFEDVLREHSFGQGLGLMSPEDRDAHLRDRARKRFAEEYASGCDFLVSKERAIGRVRS